jgi:4-amino-4-deoxy-L-arabinose transferase-like glycosyltransferase
MILYKKSILTIICLGFAAFFIFYKLASYPIFIWDEAIYANNALEMVLSGDPIVLRLDGEPNTYNSKPPFVIWLQALSVLLFGPNELAIRVPSAMASFGTCILLLVFAEKVLKNIWIGFISVLFLSTTPGFIRAHVSRTGDLDAVLVFFITLYVLLFITYIIKKPIQYKPWFITITICLFLAFLSKSIAGFIPLLGLFCVSLIDKTFIKIVSLKFTWVCAFLLLMCCTMFYMVREICDPGYLEITFKSEYLRFFQNIMPWHEHPYYFYIRNWVYMKFFWPYLILFPICLLFAFTFDTSRKVATYLMVIGFIYLVTISYPKVKLEWYDAPLYPIFSLLLGIGIVNLVSISKGSRFKPALDFSIILTAFVFIILSAKTVFNRINTNLGLPKDPLEQEGYFMKEVKKEFPNLDTYDVIMKVSHPAHVTQAKFYATSFTMQGADINVALSLDSIQPGNKYLLCQDTVKNYITKKFEFNSLYSKSGCQIVSIIKYK